MSWLDRRSAGTRLVHARIAQLPLASEGELGESPLWPSLAVLSAACLYATLPTPFVAGSGTGLFGAIRWAVPAATVLLLAPLALHVPQKRVLESAAARMSALRLGRRVASLAVIALITAANAASIALLVHLLVNGSQTQANLLLRAGIHMWLMNVLVFGLWYWQLDGGGPILRRLQTGREPDFLYPQQAIDPTTPWQPRFLDYLYVSYTNASAFSPTDTMPLSVQAKTLMTLQSAASLLLGIMVVARAINILH